MQINQLYEATITFIIKGEQYILSQHPSVPIKITDDRTLNAVKTPDGGFVTFGSNLQTPFIIECLALNINKSVGVLLEKTWNENLNNNMDYRFTIVMQGRNTQAEDVKITFKNCVFKHSPLQVEIGQDLASTRLSMVSSHRIAE